MQKTEFSSRDEYKSKLRELQSELCNKISSLDKNKYLIIVFEGLDASGKSGCIKRITKRLPPPKYSVVRICAPTREELSHHYLWRFWKTLPERGNVSIYDRSWYGRVLVERVENLAAPEEWNRAYGEINSFEEMLTHDGAVIVKIWLDVSKDVQLARFRERQNDPEKHYKITSEDWRNREKREEYDKAMRDMLEKTDTRPAKWNIISADDKHAARIASLEAIISSISEDQSAGSSK